MLEHEQHVVNGKVIELRAIPDWPRYFAGDDGVIYSDRSGDFKPLKPQYNKKTGVWTVNLYNPRNTYFRKDRASTQLRPKPIAVHTLVARAFLGPKPEGAEVDHIRSNELALPKPERRLDNSPSNLRYVTNTVNQEAHRANPNRVRAKWGVRFSEAEVRAIRALDGVLLNKEIAVIFNTRPNHIGSIINRRIWKSVK